MCTVSMVYDWGQQRDVKEWDRQSLDDLLKAIEAAKVVDTITGQPDCEDPAKGAFLKRVRLRVKAKGAAESLGLTGEQVDAFVLGAEWASERRPEASEAGGDR